MDGRSLFGRQAERRGFDLEDDIFKVKTTYGRTVYDKGYLLLYQIFYKIYMAALFPNAATRAKRCFSRSLCCEMRAKQNKMISKTLSPTQNGTSYYSFITLDAVALFYGLTVTLEYSVVVRCQTTDFGWLASTHNGVEDLPLRPRSLVPRRGKLHGRLPCHVGYVAKVLIASPAPRTPPIASQSLRRAPTHPSSNRHIPGGQQGIEDPIHVTKLRIFDRLIPFPNIRCPAVIWSGLRRVGLVVRTKSEHWCSPRLVLAGVTHHSNSVRVLWQGAGSHL